MAAWGKEDLTDKIWLDCTAMAMAYSSACWDQNQTSQAIASFSLSPLSSSTPPIWHLVARTVKAATKTCEARIGWLGGKNHGVPDRLVAGLSTSCYRWDSLFGLLLITRTVFI